MWTKGETSGHTLQVIDVYTDCDQDTLLIKAQSNGPTCHLNRVSCFNVNERDASELVRLEQTIANRAQQGSTSSSYTAKLLESGIPDIAQKVGEEAVETVIAGCVQSDAQLLNETADLMHHLLVLLFARQLSIKDVMNVLRERRQKNTVRPLN